MLAENAGQMLDGCNWVGVIFAGGMSELKYIKARTILVNDTHSHVINLASVIANPGLKDEMVRRLNSLPFHPDVLRDAQKRCVFHERQAPGYSEPHSVEACLEWAVDFFTCSWMARNGKAGTDDEFSTGMSLRYEASGGDSAVRFRNATESLNEWSTIMRRCTFSTDDCFVFLDKCKDIVGNAIYCDPPFPGPGDAYKHKFSIDMHRKLAARLLMFENCRVSCRFYDSPLIRELYPEAAWNWHTLVGRTQANKKSPELLLVRNSSNEQQEQQAEAADPE